MESKDHLSISPIICPYCYPEKVDHKQEKLNSFLSAFISKPISYIFNLLSFNKQLYFTDRYLVATIIVLRKFNKIQLQHDARPEQMVNRIRLLWNEAKNRGLSIHSFSLYNRQLLSFLLIYKEKNYYFHYSPTTLLHKHFRKFKDPTIYDDKNIFKSLLRHNELPHPEGKAFFSKTKAFNYGKKLGFPLVVKPASSSLSLHVSLQINDDSTLKKAIDIAKIINCRIIVERFISGDVHRMMFVGDQFLVCSKRQPASIIGDGQSTISELIDAFNNNPLRGNVGSLGVVLFKIEKGKQLKEYLNIKGLSLNSILERGKKIFLADKSNISNGAEVINLTEEVCDENVKLFEKVHVALGIAVSAIDFICMDVSKPWYSQPFAFLENNSFPAIDPQHFPSTGKAVDVAKVIWDFVLYHLDIL